MKSNFNEKSFLSDVKFLNTLLPNQINDTISKELFRTVIKDNGYDKMDVYNYIKDLIEEHSPELLNKRIGVKGWKDIYNHFIKNPDYPKLGKRLKESPVSIKTEGEYSLYFQSCISEFGFTPEDVMLEITLDCIGWTRILDTLVCMCGELGIEIVLKSVGTVSKRGRRPKKGSEKMEDESPEISEVVVSTFEESMESTDVELGKEVEISHETKFKRGYNQEIQQFRLVEEFDSMESASLESGDSIEGIKDSLKGKRVVTVNDNVWKYIDRKGVRIGRFQLLHTYQNLSDINNTSMEICGIRIYHSNVSNILKGGFKSICCSQFVWIRIETQKVVDMTDTKLFEKKISKSGRNSKRDKKLYEVYYLKGEELDIERGPIGTYRFSDLEKELGVNRSMVSKYLSPDYPKTTKVKCTIGEETLYIGFRVVVPDKTERTLESAA